MTMDSDEWMAELANYCDDIVDDEDHPDYDMICIVSNWMTWLWEKPRELFTLEEELAEVKFGAWRELLDFHLWSDPESLREAFRVLRPGQADGYLSVFKDYQNWAREDLAAHGYERLCPLQGALVVPGEAVVAPNISEWTDREELDGRVFEVRPGKAGYRRGGKILAPATVVCYKYRPETEAPN